MLLQIVGLYLEKSSVFLRLFKEGDETVIRANKAQLASRTDQRSDYLHTPETIPAQINPTKLTLNQRRERPLPPQRAFGCTGRGLFPQRWSDAGRRLYLIKKKRKAPRSV